MPQQPKQPQQQQNMKQRQGQNQEKPAMSPTQNTGKPEEQGTNRQP